LGRDAQIQRTRPEDHRSFTFERNLVYWRTGELLAGRRDRLNADFDRNGDWRGGGKEVRFAQPRLGQWGEKGQDRHSLVADPLFLDADRGDFRLAPQSPAAKVGFVPPDWSGLGPRRAEP